MWFLKRKNIQKTKLDITVPKILGFMSTSKSLGLTHFTLMLYCYLKGFYNKKIAYITYDKEFFTFSKTSEDENIQRDVYFGLSYQEIMTLKDFEMDYILVDYGNRFSEFREEFLRSDIRFLMGSLSIWQRDAFLNYLQYESENILRGVHVLYHFGEKKMAERVKRMGYSDLIRIPDCENPFYLTKDLIHELMIFDEILEI